MTNQLEQQEQQQSISSADNNDTDGDPFAVMNEAARDDAEEAESAAAIPVDRQMDRRVQFASLRGRSVEKARRGFAIPRWVNDINACCYGTFSSCKDTSHRKQYNVIHEHRDDGFGCDNDDLLPSQSTAQELHHAKGRWDEDSWQIKAMRSVLFWLFLLFCDCCSYLSCVHLSFYS